MRKQYVTLTVNGREHRSSIGNGLGQVPPLEALSQILRKGLQLTGLKESRSEGACGCRTVFTDRKGATPCMLLAMDYDRKDIVTTEGLEDPEKGLDPLQQAFIDEYVSQYGYCIPGIIMAVKALLLENPHPTGDEIKETMSGNYCRCISHYMALRVINKVAGNEENHLAVTHRANDDMENPTLVRQELFLSPYVNGVNSDHSLN